jgi:hypothetical protein
MADRQIEPAGCLGRVLTLLGIIWLGIVVFSGIFGLRDSAGSLGALIGSTLPGLLLIGVGRTLSRRAAERRDAPSLPQPSAPPTPSSTPKSEPSTTASPPPTKPSEVFPKPARAAPAPGPDTEAQSELPPPPLPPAPKSSQEMIEEARKRWGRKPPGP